MIAADAENVAAAVVAVLRGVLGEAHGRIALHEPRFSGNEWDYVKECLDTGWVSSVGSFVDRFERDLAVVCEVPHVVATVNGTAALHIALRVAGVGAEDEVIVPSLTFMATAAAISYCGAIPHFADSEEASCGLSAEAVEQQLARCSEVTSGGLRNKKTGRRIAAILPVHIFGHPVDMGALCAVARRYNVPVVEDAAEALGSRYKGRAAGCDGLISTLSFNGNKVVTTGGGGAIFTRDPKLAARAKHLTTTARVKDRWTFVHDDVGYNYRMPNINAALGCAQLEQLPVFLAAKRALHERYKIAFAGLKSLRLFSEQPWARSNHWLNCIFLDDEDENLRNEVLAATQAAGYETRPVWKLLHTVQPFLACPRGDLSVATRLETKIISLPSSAVLGLT